MASRGVKVQAEGSDGSDGDFRQKVDDRYKQAPRWKRALTKASLAQNLFYLGLVAQQGWVKLRNRGMKCCSVPSTVE